MRDDDFYIDGRPPLAYEWRYEAHPGEHPDGWNIHSAILADGSKKEIARYPAPYMPQLVMWNYIMKPPSAGGVAES